MSANANGRIRFGDFEFDLEAEQLFRAGQRVKIQPQPLRVLQLLVERPGETVSREDLRSHIWNGATFVEFDQGLNYCIRHIRQALSDNALNPTYVETLPKQGYRFIAEVVQPANAKKAEAVAEPIAHLAAGPSTRTARNMADRTLATRQRRVLLWIVPTGLGFLILLAAVTNVGGIRTRVLRPPASAIHSIAVLPLENLSGDSKQEYFAEGVTEELTTELAQIGDLNVISHTSAAQYDGTKKSLPQIARELGADAVVEGAVERSGDTVMITVQLIQGSSDRHLWARSYKRSIRDVLDLQREVAHALANEIQAKRLTLLEKAERDNGGFIEPEAYERYLKGKFSLERGELRKSIAYFQEAIQESPNYAPAYAGLANAFICMGQSWFPDGDMPPKQVLPQAEAYARKALALNNALGEGHLALGRVIQLYDWNWPEVEREYRQSLQLNPNDVLAHVEFAEFLEEMGRNDEALLEGRRAVALDPVNPSHVADVGYLYFTAREYDLATVECRKALELDPNSVPGRVVLGWVYEQQKKYPEAIAELEQAVSLSNRQEVPLAGLGRVLAKSGRKRDAEKVLAELNRRSRVRYVSPCLIALVQAGLGQRDQAMSSLEQGLVNRDQWMLCLKVDPLLDELRGDPRFRSLLRNVGFQ